MNLAVKLYSSVSSEQNPKSIPGVWPVQVKELGESTELPGETWQLMTVSELQAYKAQHQETYDAWKDQFEFLEKKELKLKEWDLITRRYIYAHYPQEKQQSLVLLLLLASSAVQNLPNRFNYIMQCVNWVMGEVLAHHYAVAAQLAAATSVAELDSAQGNFEQFNATDPEVGLSEAFAIQD